MIHRSVILLNGEWTLADLDYLSRSLNITYAYFFWLVKPIQFIPANIREAFARDVWSREYIDETFPHYLLGRVPNEEQARIHSIKYASPGWIELAAAASAFSAVALCVRAWLTTADRAIETLQKLQAFLRKAGTVVRSRPVQLDERAIDALNEAGKLCSEAAPVLGITKKELANIVDLTGNPISALRLMVAIAKSSQRLADLQRQGKLRLPDP